MAGFGEVSESRGVDAGAQPRPFMAVPYKGLNLVILTLGKGGRVPKGDHHVKVEDVTGQPLGRLALEMAEGHGWGALMGLMGQPRPKGDMKRLLLLTGRQPGLTKLTAGKGLGEQLDVAVLRPKTASVTFKFFHRLDEAGKPLATMWRPEDAAGLLEEINAIYGPQANVTFTLAKTEKITVNERFGPVVMDEVYEAYLKGRLDKGADITVFLVGRWAHSPVNPVAGTHFLYGKNSAIILNDKPTPEGSGVDPFRLTLAHELAHAIGGNHLKRNHVLMSNDLQSLRISKELVEALNHW